MSASLLASGSANPLSHRSLLALIGDKGLITPIKENA
jgi:hypothetical protein